ncbi:MAG: extracellular solute-binding protein [Trueperaceae bacterium]|nr:extracellular solute-binding protein [Trueperaceae bacterium]
MKRIALAVLALLVASMASAQTLTVWVWDINKPALESTIDSFAEMHPGVEVVVEDLGNQNVYDRGLAGCAAGGLDMPDVYLVENNEAQVFWAQFPDCFTDLRTLGGEELLPLFPDFKWSELTEGDAIYAVPYDSGPTAIFYRRDLYEQAGVDPAEIATWEDFAEAGTAVNEAFDGNVKMGTIAKGGDDEWFRMLANQAACFYFDEDATEITVNQPGCVQAMETMKMLWDASVLHAGGWVEQIQLIQNDAAASAFFGSWYGGVIQAEAPDQSGQWGVYLTPAQTEGGVRASNLGGSALAIPASTDNPELAYDFVVNALADEANQLRILFDYGLTPSLLSLQGDPALETGVEFFGDQPIWNTILGTLGDVPAVSGTQFFEEARNVMIVVVNDYLDGNYDSAQEALDQAARQIASSTGLPIAE